MPENKQIPSNRIIKSVMMYLFVLLVGKYLLIIISHLLLY